MEHLTSSDKPPYSWVLPPSFADVVSEIRLFVDVVGNTSLARGSFQDCVFVFGQLRVPR